MAFWRILGLGRGISGIAQVPGVLVPGFSFSFIRKREGNEEDLVV